MRKVVDSMVCTFSLRLQILIELKSKLKFIKHKIDYKIIPVIKDNNKDLVNEF